MKDGGPAFPPKTPIFIYYPQDAGKQLEEELQRADDGRLGLSIRDWFAGQALAGVMTKAAGLGDMEATARADLFLKTATVIYEMADAMLKAREATANG